MFVWFGTKTKVQRVKGGRVEQRECPECEETANFVECVATESVSVFSVVELMDSTETLFRCSYCGELFREQGADAEDAIETAEERRRRRHERLLEEAEQAREKREMERAVAEAKAEVQLEELKVKMGLAAPREAEPEPKQPARRRRWPWRRKRD